MRVHFGWPVAGLAVALAAGGVWTIQRTAEAPAAREPGQPNRLAREQSSYLQQHAHNPVDWYPWGEEAFARARRENKPIFLSVGYSTCHWCHVMERESFSDPAIAALLNQHFVSIKVDREERPDVDQVYMNYVQATTGGGGWPMSVFLTPELQPFFGGTYFPPESRHGRPGFGQLLERVRQQWGTNREAILSSAGGAADFLKGLSDPGAGGELEIEEKLLDATFRWYAQAYDPEQGGFGRAPKFPRPVNLKFLLRYHARTGEEQALEMAAHTLRRMAGGGMHDHLGGGFHRYSTDDRWFLPHFEKMLYDQAQLAVSYLEAYQLTGDPSLAQTARGILEYVLRDLTGPEGGFHSAEDADSALHHERPDEHAEGAFYVWSWGEIEKLLGEDAALFGRVYGVKEEGNVSHDPFGEFGGKNVLYAAAGVEEAARELDLTVAEVRERLERSRAVLFEARRLRPRPLLDDKVLTAWNGLMISAFARGHRVLDEPRYGEAARRAAELVAARLYHAESKTLKRRFRKGSVAIDGFADDYAFYVQGLLDLYEATLEGRWLLLALDLTETQNRLFRDSRSGAFFSTSGKDPSILTRVREDYDGAEPSPASVAALNLLRLAQMTNREQWRSMAEQAIRAVEGRLVGSPQAMPQMMVAADFLLAKPKQVLIAGEAGAADTEAILREVQRRFLPRKVVLLADGGPVQQRLREGLEILDSLRRIDSKATAYVCEDYVYQLPTNDPAVVARLLGEGSRQGK